MNKKSTRLVLPFIVVCILTMASCHGDPSDEWAIRHENVVVSPAKSDDTDDAISKMQDGIKLPPATRPNIGDTATVSEWRWVGVKNTEPVIQHYSNDDVPLAYGDTCGTEAGGTLKVLGIDDKTEQVLVEYAAPGRQVGTPCPSGVVFLVGWREFSTETAQFNKQKRATDDERRLIEGLRKQSPEPGQSP